MNSFVAVVAGLVVTGLVAGSADAAVLCVKKKGQIVQRASVCKSQKQEVALNLAQVPGATGAQGPTGPAGPQGPAGPAGSNGYSIFSTLPIDLSTLTGLTSVAHLDLPAGNYPVMGKMVVNSLLPTLADCNLQSGSSILDVAGLGPPRSSGFSTSGRPVVSTSSARRWPRRSTACS